MLFALLGFFLDHNDAHPEWPLYPARTPVKTLPWSLEIRRWMNLGRDDTLESLGNVKAGIFRTKHTFAHRLNEWTSGRRWGTMPFIMWLAYMHEFLWSGPDPTDCLENVYATWSEMVAVLERVKQDRYWVDV